MPFFQRLKTKRKPSGGHHKSEEPKVKKRKILSDEVESESDSELDDQVSSSEDDDDKHLTVQEKKVKLAKQYLAQVELAEREKLANEDGDVNGAVLKRLKDAELAEKGKLRRSVADRVDLDVEQAVSLRCKQHGLSVTCLVVSRDNRYVYSSSKDWSIVRWSLVDRCKLTSISFKRPKKQNGVNKSQPSYHNSTINCLEVSRDDKYLISGDDKGVINVWLADTLRHVHKFQAHKQSVTDVAVCRETNSLYSASKEALVKVWSLEELAYVETLFGHQAAVTSLDVLDANRVLSSGGADKTVRVWKLREESCLAYNGHEGGIELARRLDDEHFVSGGDDGALCLWSAQRKKPLQVVERAHGAGPANGQPNWVSALAVCPGSDLVASGSCDGWVRLWRWAPAARTLKARKALPVAGYVNGLRFTADGGYLVAGVGKEHRLGRWHTVPEARNQVLCIPVTVAQQSR